MAKEHPGAPPADPAEDLVWVPTILALVQEAVERSLSGRTGVYDVTVRDSAGRTVALFRGKSYRIAGEVIAGLAAEQA